MMLRRHVYLLRLFRFIDFRRRLLHFFDVSRRFLCFSNIIALVLAAACFSTIRAIADVLIIIIIVNENQRSIVAVIIGHWRWRRLIHALLCIRGLMATLSRRHLLFLWHHHLIDWFRRHRIGRRFQHPGGVSDGVHNANNIFRVFLLNVRTNDYDMTGVGRVHVINRCPLGAYI